MVLTAVESHPCAQNAQGWGTRQENLIREAAQRRGENLTDFVLRSACVEAELTLSDKRDFALPPEKWRAFLKALDNPPVIKPQLKKLFSEVSVLEAER